MEPMEDEGNQQEEFEIVGSDTSASSPQDRKFDRVVEMLQAIVIDTQFERSLGEFMANNWGILDDPVDPLAEKHLFQVYKQQMSGYLEKLINPMIVDFKMDAFLEQLQERTAQVDQQLLDTLLSFTDCANFKQFIKDYRNSYEQEQMLKVLTIKSNKMPGNKKVKGRDNIFASQQAAFELKPKQHKKKVIEKTEEEILVPDLLLTIKPIRKS